MSSSQTKTCILTSRGMSAIASIAIKGRNAHSILQKVFKPENANKATAPDTGQLIHGTIVDGDHIVDEVLVGCERKEYFVIHCHGNPLLVEQIVKLIQSHGAVLMGSNQELPTDSGTLIEAEAKLAMQKSATVWGVKVLQDQTKTGLLKWVQEMLDKIDTFSLQELQKECARILDRSRIGRHIHEGIRIVIAGPPNSGKSTLLNCLAGQQQVIVSDTAGTTRDWVGTTCYFAQKSDNQNFKIRVEVFDTAGLDELLTVDDDLEQTAQSVTKELLNTADLILYVQDITAANDKPDHVSLHNKPVIYVYNKCDLLKEHKDCNKNLNGVFISAQERTQIDHLIEQVFSVLGLFDFDPLQPFLFTPRQFKLIDQLGTTTHGFKEILNELLYGEKTNPV